MRCWILFHREVRHDVPEAPEIIRFREAAARSEVELHVLQPRDFDLVVDGKAIAAMERRSTDGGFKDPSARAAR